MQSSHAREELSAEREVDLVRNREERNGGQQQPVARRPPRRPEQQLHERDQQQDVHRRVRRVDQPRAGRDDLVELRPDEEDPLHRCDRHRDDRGVEQRDPARVTAELAQEQQDRQDDHRVAREIEGIRDRRQRRLAVQPDLVHGEDDVTADLAEEPGGEQVPRQPLGLRAQSRTPRHRRDRCEPDQHVADRPAVARQERIHRDRDGAEHEEQPRVARDRAEAVFAGKRLVAGESPFVRERMGWGDGLHSAVRGSVDAGSNGDQRAVTVGSRPRGA